MANVKKEALRELRSRNSQINSDSTNSAQNNNKRNRVAMDGEDEIVTRRNLRSKNLAGGENSQMNSDSTNSAENNNNNNNNNKKNKSKQNHVEIEGEDEIVVRRNLRSKYLAVKNLIGGETEGSSTPDSDRFKKIFNEVESLHKQVQKPREQVADAEALFDIANSFMKSVKAQRNEGATPADFVSSLLTNFGRQDRASSSSVDGARNSIIWKDVGVAVSHIFRKSSGCSTMIGPMDAEIKIRKTGVRRKHVKPTHMARPEELNNGAEEKTDTDKNMFTMFGLLRKHRKVRLENLVVNRTSFAQTVENLFALSFLVKDGRAEITANEHGHFVCPRNAPDAKAIESGKVSYSHFVFRLDFKDWKTMMDTVVEGDELMPHRYQVFDVQANASDHSRTANDSRPAEPETTAAATTPIRMLSRNRGLVVLEQTVVDESPESDENISRASYIRKGKRKLMS